MDHNRYDYSPIIKRQPVKWPNGARVAVWVIPNIEYYEFEIPSVGHQPFNLVPDIINYGWRDYGPRVGIWRLMEALDKYGIRGSVTLNSSVCEHYPIIVEEGKKRNWEFLGHGITNSRLLNGLSKEEEKKVIQETIQTITKTIRKTPGSPSSPLPPTTH